MMKLLKRIIENSLHQQKSTFLKSSLSSSSANKDTIIVEDRTPHIRLIGLNRPDKRNAINRETADKLRKAFEDFDSDQKSLVGILHGFGGSFCAGYDLEELAVTSPDDIQRLIRPAPLGPSWMMLSKPVIAAIDGYAVAGGFELALWCDLRVVETTAIMGFFCRRFGVPLIDGGTVRLSKLIGHSRALDLILTGRGINGNEAFSFGLANRLVPVGTALGQAFNLAHSLVKFPQECLQADRRSAYYATFGSYSMEDALRYEFDNSKSIIASKSIQGAKRFKEEGIGKHGKFILDKIDYDVDHSKFFSFRDFAFLGKMPKKSDATQNQFMENELKSSNCSFSHEYLPSYYKFLFPHGLFYQWLSYANVESEYFARREFSFTLSGDIYLRFNSYNSLAEMRRSIMERLPTKIDIGAVYNFRPRDSRKIKLLSFQPVERELIFDIDMTDYDDVRSCCQGADICSKCWMFMVVAARILEAFLRQDFGFQNILWVYSGRRGIHCWVIDERARRLKLDARDAIANFINIFEGGQFKAKKVEIDGMKSVHPSIIRSIRIIDDYFEELMINKQDFLQTKDQIKTIANLCLDQQLRDEIIQTLQSSDPKLKTSLDKWRMICRLSQKFYQSKGTNQLSSRNIHRHRYFLEEVKLQLCYPRLDINVTRGLNHLLKVPFSVHPKTGRICVPIDFEQIDQFDPFTVPTVDVLCKELDQISVRESSIINEDGNNNAGIAYKTSLANSLNLFRQFINGMEHSLRQLKMSNNDDKLSF